MDALRLGAVGLAVLSKGLKGSFCRAGPGLLLPAAAGLAPLAPTRLGAVCRSSALVTCPGSLWWRKKPEFPLVLFHPRAYRALPDQDTSPLQPWWYFLPILAPAPCPGCRGDAGALPGWRRCEAPGRFDSARFLWCLGRHHPGLLLLLRLQADPLYPADLPRLGAADRPALAISPRKGLRWELRSRELFSVAGLVFALRGGLSASAAQDAGGTSRAALAPGWPRGCGWCCSARWPPGSGCGRPDRRRGREPWLRAGWWRWPCGWRGTGTLPGLFLPRDGPEGTGRLCPADVPLYSVDTYDQTFLFISGASRQWSPTRASWLSGLPRRPAAVDSNHRSLPGVGGPNRRRWAVMPPEGLSQSCTRTAAHEGGRPRPPAGVGDKTMTMTSFSLILTGVLLNAAAQLLLKAGVRALGAINWGSPASRRPDGASPSSPISSAGCPVT